MKFAAARHLRAAYVAACAGSLKVAAIRFADQPQATMVEGPLEIVSLTGTVSPDGPASPHQRLRLEGAQRRRPSGGGLDRASYKELVVN